MPRVRVCGALQLRPPRPGEPLRGRPRALPRRGQAAPGRPQSPVDRARSRQVHPLRALHPHLQRGGRGRRLRVRQPRLQHRGPPRPGGVPARHRLRQLRALRRDLSDRRHHPQAAARQARPVEDDPGRVRLSSLRSGLRPGLRRARGHPRHPDAPRAGRPHPGSSLQEGPLRLRLRPGPGSGPPSPRAGGPRAAGDDPGGRHPVHRDAAQGALRQGRRRAGWPCSSPRA